MLTALAEVSRASVLRRGAACNGSMYLHRDIILIQGIDQTVLYNVCTYNHVPLASTSLPPSQKSHFPLPRNAAQQVERDNIEPFGAIFAHQSAATAGRPDSRIAGRQAVKPKVYPSIPSHPIPTNPFSFPSLAFLPYPGSLVFQGPPVRADSMCM